LKGCFTSHDPGSRHLGAGGDAYEAERDIGPGRFGKVVLAHERDQPSKKVAIRYVQIDAHTQVEDRLFMRELEVFVKVRRHAAIAGFFGYTLFPRRALVLEYLPFNSLADRLANLPIPPGAPPFDDTARAITVFGFAAGMMHLHAHGACHRYLTPKNIMYDSQWHPRLVDFGFAKTDIDDGTVSNYSHGGQAEYISPEVHENTGYNQSTDVFSFAMILYHLATGNIPFHTMTPLARLAAIVRADPLDIPKTVSPLLSQIIKRCAVRAQDKRPRFAHIVKRFHECDIPLFPGTDMARYREYRDFVLEQTLKSAEDKEVFRVRAVRQEDVHEFERYKELADPPHNQTEAQLYVGKMYEAGKGVGHDDAKAYEYYMRAAGQEDPVGMYLVGNCLMAGVGVDRDKFLAFQWYQLAHARFPMAAVRYAVLLEKGVKSRSGQIAANPREALRILEGAAAGLWEAQYHAGRLHCSITRDYAAARRYFEMAQAGGQDGPTVQLAIMDLNGWGSPPNIERGINLLRQAAGRHSAAAHHNLGLIASRGDFRQARDSELAKAQFMVAADLQHPEACVKYAGLLLAEPGGGNEASAAHYLKVAADLGEPIGCFNYARLLMDGRGIPRDVPLAVQYFMEAFNLGVNKALLYLGDIYRHGLHGPRNFEVARDLYERARAAGVAEAGERIRDMDAK
jgi:TPR repeat protein/serine/threonine protein kinase